MTITELKEYLHAHPQSELRFLLPEDAGAVPAHAHVTEVGRVDKVFMDCGGEIRRETSCRLQVWVAEDLEHRLLPSKLAEILNRAEGILGTEELPVEIEYEDGFISQFPVAAAEAKDGVLIFALVTRHTDCLAKEICLPPETNCCSGKGCC